MKVSLKLLGPLKYPSGDRSPELELRRGVSVGRILKEALRYNDRELELIQVVKDGKAVSLDDKIDEDTTLQVILRLGGG